MAPSTVTLLTAIILGFAEGAVYHGVRISPELEPESDKKFFGKNGDYPTDRRPAADRHYVFDHPYPAVQDSSDYDRDYVKDENKDNGEWKAHMEYDQLRSKIREAEAKLDELRKKMEEEEKEWKDAKAKYEETGKAADDAEKDRKAADQEAKDAEKKVDEIGGDRQGGGAIGDAVKKVEGEMSDLEKCKEELAKTKKRLEELMKEKEALDAKAKETEEAQKKDKAERVQAHKDKEAERKDAEKYAEEKAFDEAAWKKKIAEETAEYHEADKSYDQELEDVKKTEAELEKAAANLRKFRRPPHVDDDGGVYYEGKSSARQSSVAAATLFVAMVSIFRC